MSNSRDNQLRRGEGDGEWGEGRLCRQGKVDAYVRAEKPKTTISRDDG